MRAATTVLAAALLTALLVGCASTTRSERGSSRQPLTQVCDDADAPCPSALSHRRLDSVASTTKGRVTVGGKAIRYQAVAGRIVVHTRNWRDTRASAGKDAKSVQPEAAMSYVAYFKEDEKADKRPITFVFNGGPGSSSLWLHMGAFGPRRVTISDPALAGQSHLVENEYSLLDVSDLIFVDAPGTGFGSVRGTDAQKAFYGTDADVDAFAEFITNFLSKNSRWNSPKYLLGEGYGALRAAVLINVLETRDATKFNGVIFLSQILNFELQGKSGALSSFNPGLDLPYELALPSYTATAWYHNMLPGGRQPLAPLLEKVRRFALTSYAQALREGVLLSRARRTALIEQLHQYTGLADSYIDRANLRIDSGEFAHELLGGSDATVGQADSRVAGPSLDPLSQRAGYDPQSAAVRSEYISAFNQYAREILHYGYGMTYKADIPVLGLWNFWHVLPSQDSPVQQWPNAMPDLANVMKFDPHLKIMVNEGYFDLETPFTEGWYEMHHLQIPETLEGNITYNVYSYGHLSNVDSPVLKNLHDQISAFIVATDFISDGGSRRAPQ